MSHKQLAVVAVVVTAGLSITCGDASRSPSEPSGTAVGQASPDPASIAAGATWASTIRGNDALPFDDVPSCHYPPFVCKQILVKIPGPGRLSVRLRWDGSSNELGVRILSDGSLVALDGPFATGASPLDVSSTVSGNTLVAVSFERSGGVHPAPSASQAFELATAFAPASASPSLAGRWQGTSTVESTGGILPACTAPFWAAAFRDVIVAEIRTLPDVQGTDLFLQQEAGEACHLQARTIADGIDAGPWPYDEFDCALVPALCGLSCHFRLHSENWGCPDTPPEVWITNLRLRGTFAGTVQDRIAGTVEVSYAHRPGGTSRAYDPLTILKRIDLVRTR